MKNILVPVIILLFTSALSFPQEEKIKDLSKENSRIDEILAGFKNLHSELLNVKMQCDDLGAKARIHQNDNMLKTYLKGLKDTYSLLTDGPSSVFDAVKGALENLYVEPYFQKARKVKVDFEKFKIERTNYTDEIQKMYAVLSLNLNSDLKYFDDDMPTSEFTKKYWRKGDNQPDDEAELCTRKLNVIIGLTGDLSGKIDSVCRQIRVDYLTLDNVKDENKRLASVLEKELKVNNEIRERQKLRMEQFAKAESFEETEKKTDTKKSGENDSRDGDDRAFMAKSIAKENKLIVDNLKKGYELGKNANVHFVVDPASKLISGWAVGMTAGLKPENALGELVWKVDDFIVGHNDLRTGKEAERKFSYVFNTPGIYDVSVTLEVEGKYIDQYLTQLTIEPGNVEKGKERSVLINVFNSGKPNMINKSHNDDRLQIVDLPYAKYWVAGIKGQEIISGYYLNKLGQKQEYTSLKIADYNQAVPSYGLFALTSLNGYHVYRTYENDKPVLTIAILKQTGPEIFKQVKDVAGFEVKITPDFSSAEVSYNTISGNKSVIKLN